MDSQHSFHVRVTPMVKIEAYPDKSHAGCYLCISDSAIRPAITIHLRNVEDAIFLGAAIERQARELAGKIHAQTTEPQDIEAQRDERLRNLLKG